MKYIIKDWAGNTMDHFKMMLAYKQVGDIPPTYFKSFEDAEYFLTWVLDDHYETDRQEYEIEKL